VFTLSCDIAVWSVWPWYGAAHPTIDVHRASSGSRSRRLFGLCDQSSGGVSDRALRGQIVDEQEKVAEAYAKLPPDDTASKYANALLCRSRVRVAVDLLLYSDSFSFDFT
jgi:hypothetical protein